MNKNIDTKKPNLKKWTVIGLLVLFDIVAVNISYYLAMVLRFYVKGQFHPAAMRYFPMMERFAPYYTICCLAVFAFFKLYSGIWRYAGLSDINRILNANIITCLVQVFGTLLFVGRMPITYYALGAGIQFVLISLSRFSYRFVSDEIKRFIKGKSITNINIMIIGVGDTAQFLIRQLELDVDNTAHPICVLDVRNSEPGRLFNGLPVLCGLESIREGIERYGIKSVVIADSLLSVEDRRRVHDLCTELDIGVQNYSSFSQNLVSGIALKSLLEIVSGPLDIIMDGVSLSFENSEQASVTLTEKYVVISIRTRGEKLIVEIQRDHTVLNDVNDEWAKAYHAETGEEISFF